MKVLHVIESLGRGGAEQLLVTQLPELKRQGVDVLVAVRGGPMDLEPDLSAAEVPVRTLKSRHRWAVCGLAKDISALAASEGADIVHAHLYFPTIATAWIGSTGMSSVKTCTTFHNLAYAGANPKTLKLEFRRRLSAWLCANGVDRFLAVSTAVADHYCAALNLSRVDVVPNPVAISELQQMGFHRYETRAVGSACHIVLPGRITREKGHADLVAALALLKTRGLVPRVTFAGDGPLRADVENHVASLELGESVTFTGAVTHADMLKLIGAADLIVIPSRFEGFGIAALEGMALGRAVVATNAGGLPETLGNAGVLVNPQDPHQLSGALEQLLMNPERRAQLGELACARAQQFDLPKVTAKLISVYSEIVSSDQNLKRA